MSSSYSRGPSRHGPRAFRLGPSKKKSNGCMNFPEWVHRHRCPTVPSLSKKPCEYDRAPHTHPSRLERGTHHKHSGARVGALAAGWSSSCPCRLAQGGLPCDQRVPQKRFLDRIADGRKFTDPHVHPDVMFSPAMVHIKGDEVAEALL